MHSKSNKSNPDQTSRAVAIPGTMAQVARDALDPATGTAEAENVLADVEAVVDGCLRYVYVWVDGGLSAYITPQPTINQKGGGGASALSPPPLFPPKPTISSHPHD